MGHSGGKRKCGIGDEKIVVTGGRICVSVRRWGVSWEITRNEWEIARN